MVPDSNPLIIETQALSLTCRREPLDEETFCVPIANLVQIELKDASKATRDYLRFTDWCHAERIMLCSTRIPHDSIAKCMFLEERGFRFIELNYSVFVDQVSRLSLPESNVSVSDATLDDREELAAMAETMFQFGRYHQDPRVSQAAANKRYGQWLRRAFENPAQRVIQCSNGANLIGFFVVEAPASNERHWSLVGLGPEFRGRGLGWDAWIAMLRRHLSEGVERVTSSISSSNLPIINLYAKLGFRFAKPRITLHWGSLEAFGSVSLVRGSIHGR